MNRGYLAEIFVSFQGEGAHVGRRHLFVRTAGCNIRCRYCDTPGSLVRTPEFTVCTRRGAIASYPNPVSVEEVIAHVSSVLRSDGPVDAISLTGGEPLLQASFLAEVLQRGKFPVPVLLETNGVLPDRLPAVLPLVDVVSMDLKLPTNTGEPEFWDVHRSFLECAVSRRVYVKILVDSGTSQADVERAVSLVAGVAPSTPAFLQPVADEAGRSLIEVGRLDAFFDLARRYLDVVRVLPQTHKQLGIR